MGPNFVSDVPEQLIHANHQVATNEYREAQLLYQLADLS
jgi:hypothetical protein